VAAVVVALGALLLPGAPAAAASNPLTDAFDQAGDGFTLADCPPSDDPRQRICSGEVPSFDGAPLDVDLTLPFNHSGSQDHPLIVMMNGFGNDKHEWQSVDDEGDGADKYHWNSHWFAKHGYYVLTYTPRGFDTETESEPYQPNTPEFSSDHPEKNGTIHLKSREFEVRDTQWLSALVAEGFDVDEDEVAVTGGSYGGGESWLQASQASWTFPSDCADATAMSGPEACRPGASDTPAVGDLDVLQLQVSVPKYPWTDLAYSLAPNGHPGPAGGIYDSATQRPDKPEKQPCYSGAQSAPAANPICNPLGVLKESYVNGFFAIGTTDGTFEDGTWTTPSEEGPINIPAWKTRAEADPYDTAGVEDPIVQQIRDGLTEYRGAYYQDEGWADQQDGRKVAIYSIQGWTDDLFTAVESFRMFNYLKALDPRWPVEVEVADVGHPRAQNRPETWRRLNAQAFQFVGSHIKGSHEQETSVSSQPTLCEDDGDPDSNETAAERITARSPTQLSNGALEIAYAPGGTTANPAGATDPNGPLTDPVLADRVLPGGDKCRESAGPALGGYTAYSEPLPDHATYVGLGTVTVPYELTGTTATLNARVWDVAPDGTELLMTRGTYRIDVPAYDTAAGTLQLPLFGNHWPLGPGHSVRLDLTQVDTPFLAPSKVASSIEFAPPTLTLPTRESGTVKLSGAAEPSSTP
jgi:predicted acyl esterase